MMRILTDTNVIISAILFPNSVVARVWAYVIKHHHVIICKYTIDELKTVFRRKFPDKTAALQHFLTHLACEITDAEQANVNIPPIRDKADLPVLLAAIVADADILLTGNKDFTDFPFNRPAIMTPGAFIKSFMQ
jgi:putative PIN family toxin of toxin-antitoxin system